MRRERGISIVEILIGVTVIVILMISFLPVFTKATNDVRQANMYSLAASLARAEMERLMGLGFEAPELSADPSGTADRWFYYHRLYKVWVPVSSQNDAFDGSVNPSSIPSLADIVNETDSTLSSLGSQFASILKNPQNRVMFVGRMRVVNCPASAFDASTGTIDLSSCGVSDSDAQLKRITITVASGDDSDKNIDNGVDGPFATRVEITGIKVVG